MTHTVALLLCSEPNALIGQCGAAMRRMGPPKIADFECEDCDKILNLTDLALDDNEFVAVDSLDNRVYIIGCHPTVQSLNEVP